MTVRTHKTGLLFVALALMGLTLVACGGGGGSPPPPGNVEVTCADVFNTGEANQCGAVTRAGAWDLFSGAWAQARPPIERGDVSRGQEVAATNRVENTGGGSRVVWVEAAFDAGCSGEPRWVIMPKTQVDLADGEAFNSGASGRCGDMPLGRRALTITVYAADASTVIDSQRVNFTLTE